MILTHEKTHALFYASNSGFPTIEVQSVTSKPQYVKATATHLVAEDEEAVRDWVRASADALGGGKIHTLVYVRKIDGSPSEWHRELGSLGFHNVCGSGMV